MESSNNVMLVFSSFNSSWNLEEDKFQLKLKEENFTIILHRLTEKCHYSANVAT